MHHPTLVMAILAADLTMGILSCLVFLIQKLRHSKRYKIVLLEFLPEQRNMTIYLLRDLHWHTVRTRIYFKICMLTYKCLDELAMQNSLTYMNLVALLDPEAR